MKDSELTELEQKYEDLKMQLSDVFTKMDALRDDAQQWNHYKDMEAKFIGKGMLKLIISTILCSIFLYALNYSLINNDAVVNILCVLYGIMSLYVILKIFSKSAEIPVELAKENDDLKYMEAYQEYTRQMENYYELRWKIHECLDEMQKNI